MVYMINQEKNRDVRQKDPGTMKFTILEEAFFFNKIMYLSYWLIPMSRGEDFFKIMYFYSIII